MPTIILSISFFVYLFATGYLAERPLRVFFHFERSLTTKLFGIFYSFILVSFILGALILFFPFSVLLVVLALVSAVLVHYLLFLLAKMNDTDTRTAESVLSLFSFSEKPNIFIALGSIVHFALCLMAVNTLLHSTGGGIVYSPWFTISQTYLYYIFASLCVLGVLIAAKAKKNLVLFMLVVQSFAIHSFLPLSHPLIYGADGWRHIADVLAILAGNGIPHVPITDVSLSTYFLTVMGNVSYNLFWSVSILLHFFTKINAIAITAWLQPILWSLIVPLMLYEIGSALGWSDEVSLSFSWLSFLPYALIVAGSFSLPVTLGFIVWLFSLLLMIKRLSSAEVGQLAVLAVLGIILTFGYALFAILFWVAFIIFEFVRIKDSMSIIAVLFLSVVYGSVLPYVEWQTKISEWNGALLSFSSIQQFVGNFSSFYLASGPRPHAIATGNVLFNQTPLSAYVVSVFTTPLWLVMCFALLFFGLATYGIWRSLVYGFGMVPNFSGVNAENQASSRLGRCALSLFGLAISISYFISRYFFTGQHLLTRRLEPVIAFVVIIFFTYALDGLYEKVKGKILKIALVIVLSFGATASLSLGPDTNATSLDEYNAMSYIWQQEVGAEKHCVLADTYPLLTLEAISGKRLVGGGFPINHNFAQPELSGMLERLDNPDVGVVQAREALETTGADHCWIVMPTTITISYFIKSTGATVTHFNSVDVWRFGKQ